MSTPQNFELQDSSFRGLGGEAIILAGGLGTRLRSVLPDIPKCMAPVNGIPFINFIISYLKNEGVEKIILSLGYKAEVVIEYIEKTFPEAGIEWVVEDKPLGTGGAVKLACKKLKGNEVLILNGDTLFNIDIKAFLDFHRQANADVTVALKEMAAFSRYGSVELNTDLSLKAFREKTYCEKGFINGGIYAVNIHSLPDEKYPDEFSFEQDFLQKNIELRKYYGFPCEYYFIDIGVPEDYDRFTRDYNFILAKNKYLPNTGPCVDDVFFEGLFSLLDN